ncbi:MAG: class I SAM-dependent methyltransferase [Nanoarchaeota archaeon]
MIRDTCLVCNSKNIKEIIDLGMHPFADTFIPKDKISEHDSAYPLVCDLCLDCGQVQLKYPTSPEERYCSLDYSYTSSNSNFSRTHWINYAKEVSSKINLKSGSLVIEVGSNDGFLTKEFINQGNKAFGVDPSEYMAKLAKERNVETVTELFNKETAEKLVKEKGHANLVVANNVFNHSENPLDFAQAAATLLAKEGVFVFELPYWAISMESGKFDQIYHEHVSYFTAKSSKELMERAGMRIFAIDVVNYHGGSLRVYAKLARDLANNCLELNNIIMEEEKKGLFKDSTYDVLMKNFLFQKYEFLARVHELKKKGASILAVGAAAKGNTFLNFYNLDSHILDYVTDSSPHKQGKYTPLTRIPITGDEVFKNYLGKEVYAVITSWNLAEQLKPILSSINPDIKFISPDNLH